MKRTYRINDELSVDVFKKRKKTVMFLNCNGKKILLSEMKTDDYFFSKLVYDSNYIVVYSRGTMVNQIPLNVEVAYSIHAKKFLDLKHTRLKVLLEYMLISRRGFDLTQVLSAINEENLGLVEQGYENELIEYLTVDSDKITKEAAIEYILKYYPKLKKYKNLTGTISVVEYKKLVEEIGNQTFWFHIMPLDLEHVKNPIGSKNPTPTDYKQIYISEYEFATKQ